MARDAAVGHRLPNQRIEHHAAQLGEENTEVDDVDQAAPIDDNAAACRSS